MERRLDATGDKLMAAEENFGAPEKALARLAAHFGIEPVFRDARGKDVVTTPETQKRLLAAMGVVADSERNCSMALDRERSADAQPPLPPVLVVHSADGCCCVEMALAHDARRITWRIELEDGTERRGVAELARPGSEASGASQQWPRLELGELPWGYHRLHLPEFGASTALIFTPGQCWLPDALREGAGLWGISAQLYLLRSEQNWGIGDFTDLAKLVEVSGQRGCEVIGLNPLHQMMLDIPEQVSPYSPLTRLYLNVLYIAVPDAPGYSSSVAVRKLVESPKFQARLAACQSAANVDYTAVVSLKLEALRILYAAFNEGISEHRQRFVNFRHEKGVSLRRTSVFQALRRAATRSGG
jgi:hypothetical protein